MAEGDNQAKGSSVNRFLVDVCERAENLTKEVREDTERQRDQDVESMQTSERVRRRSEDEIKVIDFLTKKCVDNINELTEAAKEREQCVCMRTDRGRQALDSGIYSGTGRQWDSTRRFPVEEAGGSTEEEGDSVQESTRL